MLNLPAKSHGWEALKEIGISPIEDHIRYKQVRFWIRQLELTNENKLLFELIKEAAVHGSRLVNYMNDLMADVGISYQEKNKEVIKSSIFGIRVDPVNREHLTPPR